MPNQIPIDDSALSNEQRETDQYHEIRQKMEQNLTRRDKLRRYSTHESGHLIYLMRTELAVVPEDVVFAGPTIYCEGDQMGYFMAAVTSKRARLSDKTLIYTGELLDKLSLVAAAGTIFEKEFEGEDEETTRASDGDENHLHKHCYKAMTNYQIPFEGYTLWSCAKKQTENQLKENRVKFEAKIEAVRPLVLAKCFGLNDMSHLR
jgi:hypothetical protein